MKARMHSRKPASPTPSSKAPVSSGRCTWLSGMKRRSTARVSADIAPSRSPAPGSMSAVAAVLPPEEATTATPMPARGKARQPVQRVGGQHHDRRIVEQHRARVAADGGEGLVAPGEARGVAPRRLRAFRGPPDLDAEHRLAGRPRPPQQRREALRLAQAPRRRA